MDSNSIDRPFWLLWTWWRGDPLLPCSSLSALTVEETEHIEIIANLMGFPVNAIREQISLGHRPYLARLRTLPVAVGWSATGEADIFGGRLAFQVPSNNRYLYAFVTLPGWRGLGIYPYLLQAILRRESQEYQRFWIIHLLQNAASQRGICKAGFRLAGTLSSLSSGGFGLIPHTSEIERAHAGAALLGLPLLN